MSDERNGAIVVAEERPPAMQLAISVQDMRRRVTLLDELYRGVMQKGTDYDEVPGTDKPTLLKPGAEMLGQMFGLTPSYEELPGSIEDWERGFFHYKVRCTLTHRESGVVVAQGIGSCNSLESKYRWRWAWPSELSEQERRALESTRGRVRRVETKRGETKQYRVENDDIYSQTNTILKMAQKRALVAAVLNATGASRIFTQDVEDLVDATEEPRSSPAPARPRQPAKPSREKLMQRWASLWNEAQLLGLDVQPIKERATDEEIIERGRELAALIEQAKRQQSPSGERPEQAAQPAETETVEVAF